MYFFISILYNKKIDIQNTQYMHIQALLVKSILRLSTTQLK